METDETIKSLQDFARELQKSLDSIQDLLTKQEVPMLVAICAMTAIVDTFKRTNPEDAEAIESFEKSLDAAQGVMKNFTNEMH